MNFNRVFLGGNLTRDVEMKTIQSGTSIAQFGLAINRRWKDAGGADKEEVTFVDCNAWGKTAETIARFFTKGKPILVEGRLKLDQWEKDGERKSKLSVVVESFTFVGGKDAATQPEAAPKKATPRAYAPAGMDLPESDDLSMPF